MGGFFGVTSKNDCVLDIFFGVDYHSHLGTKKGGMALHSKEKGFQREIHNIENTDRKSTRLNSSHASKSRMPSSA